MGPHNNYRALDPSGFDLLRLAAMTGTRLSPREAGALVSEEHWRRCESNHPAGRGRSTRRGHRGAGSTTAQSPQPAPRSGHAPG